MTDNEIIKALECCAVAYDCPVCPFNCECGNMGNLSSAAIDLINRQKAELEELKEDYIPKLKWGLKRANEIGMSQDAEIERLKAEIEEANEAAREAEVQALKESKENAKLFCEAMGIEMSFTTEELNRVTELCKHMVGLDHKSPYHRHGKAFYKPYRNYYCALAIGIEILDRLPKHIMKVDKSEKYSWYYLSNDGFKWLGRQLNIIIKLETEMTEAQE